MGRPRARADSCDTQTESVTSPLFRYGIALELWESNWAESKDIFQGGWMGMSLWLNLGLGKGNETRKRRGPVATYIQMLQWFHAFKCDVLVLRSACLAFCTSHMLMFIREFAKFIQHHVCV